MPIVCVWHDSLYLEGMLQRQFSNGDVVYFHLIYMFHFTVPPTEDSIG